MHLYNTSYNATILVARPTRGDGAGPEEANLKWSGQKSNFQI